MFLVRTFASIRGMSPIRYPSVVLGGVHPSEMSRHLNQRGRFAVLALEDLAAFRRSLPRLTAEPDVIPFQLFPLFRAHAGSLHVPECCEATCPNRGNSSAQQDSGRGPPDKSSFSTMSPSPELLLILGGSTPQFLSPYPLPSYPKPQTPGQIAIVLTGCRLAKSRVSAEADQPTRHTLKSTTNIRTFIRATDRAKPSVEPNHMLLLAAR